MKIAFSGFDNPIVIERGRICTLQVMNEGLYSRVCQSLLGGGGEQAVEPYTIWDDEGEEINPRQAFLSITNPFDIPWKHKSLTGSLYSVMNSSFLHDEDLRAEFDELGKKLISSVSKMGHELIADYEFGVKWELDNYLKAFSYGVSIPEDASLIDNLIGLLDLAADMALKEALLFVNLKTFLTENDLHKFYERAFFLESKVLLLEHYDANQVYEIEDRMVIDRDFVELMAKRQLESPSLSQEGICSNGFGAVTF